MNRTEQADIVASVIAAWPNPPMPDIVTETWLETVERLDYRECREAVKALIREREYRPTPSDIVGMCAPVLRPVPFVPELVEGVLPPERQLANLKSLREQIAANATRKRSKIEPDAS